MINATAGCYHNIKPELKMTVKRMEEMYMGKIEELRMKGEETGKHLIGIIENPWTEMNFLIGSGEDYTKAISEAEKIERENNLKRAVLGGMTI